MAALDVTLLPALSDNYIYLVREPEAGTVAVVDPATAEPVVAALDARGWGLDLILNTHHHGDHIGGNAALKGRYGATVVAPRADRHRIATLDVAVGEGDVVAVGRQSAQVLETPGHTSGHVAYWFADAGALFCGDTLFSLGCGRLFEGTPGQMWQSLCKLRALSDEARIYCGHEYTQANARFAVTVDPANATLRQMAGRIDALRARGEPTIPSRLGDEKAANPFLRADAADLQTALGMTGADPVAVFAEVRGRKDRF